MPKLIQFTPATIAKSSERRKSGPAEVVVFATPRTGRTIVIDEVRDRIVRAWDRGVDTRQLAREYRIDRMEIERIVHGQRNQYRRAA